MIEKKLDSSIPINYIIHTHTHLHDGIQFDHDKQYTNTDSTV